MEDNCNEGNKCNCGGSGENDSGEGGGGSGSAKIRCRQCGRIESGFKCERADDNGRSETCPADGVTCFYHRYGKLSILKKIPVKSPNSKRQPSLFQIMETYIEDVTLNPDLPLV